MPGTILVIEDNALLRDVAVLALRKAGYAAVESSGVDAPAQAVALRPNAILLDLGLPDIDGAEVYRRLKADERTASTPIIAMTGATPRGGLDVEDILTKPFTVQMLLHKVQHWANFPDAKDAIDHPHDSRVSRKRLAHS